MVYGLGYGPVYPVRLKDDGLCDCGRPKAAGDFMCLGCRAQLEKWREDQRDLARAKGQD